MVEQEDVQLTPNHEHIKNASILETFSLKTNWRLAERLL